MVVASHPTCRWSAAVTRPATEFPLTPLTVVEGTLPADLQGTLYRNGPGRLERGGQRMGHWFDGDGAILAVHFEEGAARATYRYVQTAGYQAEAEADRLLFGNYGMVPPGPIWKRFGKSPKNVANTSVLALGDRLLALWEAGEPHALTLDSLETLDLGPLEGLTSLPYSAHPKRDPFSGEIYNFGVSFGRRATLNLYRSDRHGHLLRRSTFPLSQVPLIHDFVLAGSYLVFVVPPVQIHTLPLLLNLSSASDAMEWKPQYGGQILIFDRETLELVNQIETEPWYQWHFGNGAVESDGSLTLTLVRYADFQTNAYLQEVSTGTVSTLARGTYWQIRLAPQSGQVLDLDCLVDAACEFPTVPPQEVGHRIQSTYLNLHRPGDLEGGELFGAIAHLHHPSATFTVADCGPGRYPSEPLFVPQPKDPSQGWVLTVVYDGNRDCSEVWLYGSTSHLTRPSPSLTDEPLCRLALPSVIPPSFHGTWKGE